MNKEEQKIYFDKLDIHILKNQKDSETGIEYDAIDVEWVKEFIKRLKEEITLECSELGENYNKIIFLIHKLSGSKLIDNPAQEKGD